MDATTVNTRMKRLALPVEALLVVGVVPVAAEVPEVTGAVDVEDVDTDVDVVAVVEGVDAGVKVAIGLCVADKLVDVGRPDTEIGRGDLVDRTDVMIRDEVVVATAVVEAAPIVLVEVPTPSDVGIVDGIGIDDVADGRGASNDPFMPVRVKNDDHPEYGMLLFPLSVVEVMAM